MIHLFGMIKKLIKKNRDENIIRLRYWIHFVLKIICTPESVSTIPLISLTCRAKVASSKGFCICPGPNMPRSPPFLAELQSLYWLASSSKEASLLSICEMYPLSISIASSLVLVMLSSLHEAGRRESLCFTRRWLARTLKQRD